MLRTESSTYFARYYPVYCPRTLVLQARLPDIPSAISSRISSVVNQSPAIVARRQPRDRRIAFAAAECRQTVRASQYPRHLVEILLDHAPVVRHGLRDVLGGDLVQLVGDLVHLGVRVGHWYDW